MQVGPVNGDKTVVRVGVSTSEAVPERSVVLCPPLIRCADRTQHGRARTRTRRSPGPSYPHQSTFLPVATLRGVHNPSFSPRAPTHRGPPSLAYARTRPLSRTCVNFDPCMRVLMHARHSPLDHASAHPPRPQLPLLWVSARSLVLSRCVCASHAALPAPLSTV